MKTIIIVILCLVLCVIGFNTYLKDYKKNANNQENSNPTEAIGQPIDYLPTTPGSILEYKIELGSIEPLNYMESINPCGDKVNITSVRGRFIAALIEFDKSKDSKKPKKILCLKLKVKGPAVKQGMFQRPIGVELVVEKDDLGVYKDAKKIFWSATAAGNFRCNEIVTYPPNLHSLGGGGPWGDWNAEDGFSMRLILFGEKPGTQISSTSGSDSKDHLIFIGVKNVPGLNVPGLCFLRIVEPHSKEHKGDYFSSGFAEVTYFVKGKGMVYLQQRVGEEVSMTWTAVN
ncbi:MAG: hypothetical protein WCL61_02915 [bacterium]